MNAVPNKARERGFGLMEALMSAAFTGLAMAGAFSMVFAAQSSAAQSSMRQELMRISADIFEHISLHRVDADDYATSLELDADACAALEEADMTDPEASRFLWCRMAQNVAPYRAGEKRRVIVFTPEAGKRVVEIVLQARRIEGGQPVEVVMQKVVEIPPE